MTTGARETSGSGGDVRSRILEAAARRFVASGYHGISMREIADDAGLSKPALYYHFRDKESLFLAILEDAVERLASLLDACEAEPTCRARLGVLLEGLFDWSPERRAVIRLASQEITHLDPAVRGDFIHRYHAAFVDRIRDFIGQGVESGELREVDPGRAAWLLLGMIYPFMLSVRSSGAEGPERLVLDVFFRGLEDRGQGQARGG